MDLIMDLKNEQKINVKKGAFLTEIEEIGLRARQHIEKSAAASDRKSDLEIVTRLLNEALATELVFVLRYKCHHYMAKGIQFKSVADEFLAHAIEDQGHADQIATRIIQLNQEPNFSIEGALTRSHPEYVEGETLLDLIREDLVAERIAIESYSEIVHYLGKTDYTSRGMLEEILASEEEHAEDMKTLLERIGSGGRGTIWQVPFAHSNFVGGRHGSAQAERQ